MNNNENKKKLKKNMKIKTKTITKNNNNNNDDDDDEEEEAEKKKKKNGVVEDDDDGPLGNLNCETSRDSSTNSQLIIVVMPSSLSVIRDLSLSKLRNNNIICLWEICELFVSDVTVYQLLGFLVSCPYTRLYR